ncbi:MAG: hypothetical protein R6U57_03200 [Anaerolineales bacterium]
MKKMLKSLTTPTRIAIFGSLIFVTLHIILLGAIYQRRSATETLQENRRTLAENLSALEQINKRKLSTLQSELESAQEEAERLRNAFPELGAPFAIYPQGKVLATRSKVELVSIALLSEDIKDSPSGPIQMKQYFLELEGNFSNCIDFLDQLEKAGLQTVSIQNISIYPEEKSCEFEVQTLGFQR